MSITPGAQSSLTGGASQVAWGAVETLTVPVQFDSTATDSGNTPTTTLRGGNIIAIETASNEAYVCDVDANDGRQIPVGVLRDYLSTLNSVGSATNVSDDIAVGSAIRTSALVGADYHTYAALWRQGFVLDNYRGAAGLVAPIGSERVTANKTLTAADNGKRFICVGSGAIEFTLPTLAHGLTFDFVNAVDQIMTVTATDKIMVDGNAAADGVSFQTSSHKIGAVCRVRAEYTDNSATLKWVVEILCQNTATVVSA